MDTMSGRPVGSLRGCWMSLFFLSCGAVFMLEAEPAFAQSGQATVKRRPVLTLLRQCENPVITVNSPGAEGISTVSKAAEP